MIGKTISHYKILEKLGEGGMGVVYKALDTALDRTVALKFLSPPLTSDPTEKERFYHEAKAASALNHPNITTIFEIQEHDRQVFIAMEYVEGMTLKQFIEHESLSIIKLLDLAIQIGDGLVSAHEKGIVHRDIKSENIMVTSREQAKIMDFGLAKVKGVTRLTKAGSTIGTAAYMSPEQAQGEEVDHRSDIFSFGIVLYELLTGKLPFRGEHQAALMYSIVNEKPQAMARFNETITPELEHIVSKALEKEKEDRYQHLDEMLTDLRRERKKIEYTTIESKKNEELSITLIRKWRKSKLIIGTAGVILLVILAIMFNPFGPKTDQLENNGAREKAIAVLPFVDMSPQKDQEYFCDGMTEELINRLSNIQELRVPARTSAFVFKGKIEDIKEIGSKLKVQTVLEGSVRKAGNELRITAQLINVKNGYHLWSETYDRKLEDVFTIQDEISAAIVNALQVKLTSYEKQRISAHPIDNIKAYEYYLKADRQIMRFDVKSIDSAFSNLQTAIDIIGENAQLYIAMSLVHSQYANIGIRQEDYLKKAEEYARKALQLQPDLSSALCALAYLSFYEDYPMNLYNSFKYYKQALSVNPNDIRGLHGISQTYLDVGKPSKAYTFVERVERLDPLNPRRYITRGFYHLYDCQFDQASEQFHSLYLIDPTSPLAQTSYSQILAFTGKQQEALTVIDRTEKSNEINVMNVFSLLLKYGLLKDQESALRLITPDFRQTCWRDAEWSYWVANRLSLTDARVEALDWLQNAVNKGFINYPFIQCDPLLENIRGEERFKKLMEKVKYEWEHFSIDD